MPTTRAQKRKLESNLISCSVSLSVNVNDEEKDKENIQNNNNLLFLNNNNNKKIIKQPRKKRLLNDGRIHNIFDNITNNNNTITKPTVIKDPKPKKIKKSKSKKKKKKKKSKKDTQSEDPKFCPIKNIYFIIFPLKTSFSSPIRCE